MKKILRHLVNSILLVAPGGVTSLGLFLFASQWLYPLAQAELAFFLLLMQLQTLGITCAKFGIDQVIFSRLNKNEHIEIRSFFLKRVLPLASSYALFILLFYTKWTATLFFFSLPLEVFAIIVITEHNVHERFFRSFILMFSGYPVIFLAITTLSFAGIKFNFYSLLLLFGCSSLLKFLLAIALRTKGKAKNLADLRLQVPLQQISNIWMFRSDQLLIAFHLYSPEMAKSFEITAFLFLAKLPEIGGSFLAYLSPILYRRFERGSPHFFFKMLWKDWLYWLMNLGLFVTFLFIYFFIDKNHYNNRMLFYFPFFFHCLLVLPVNLITYTRFKSADLRQNNYHSFFAILLGTVLVILATVCKSAFLFTLSVPLQLLFFIFLYRQRTFNLYVDKVIDKHFKNV